jgi:hypothetical protein
MATAVRSAVTIAESVNELSVLFESAPTAAKSHVVHVTGAHNPDEVGRALNGPHASLVPYLRRAVAQQHPR